jgi:ATP-binding cassette subfamily F protein 3
MALIEVNGLHKDYGGDPVLHDVSFTIEPGEKLALIGRNGCGKTSLLRILTGTDDDYRGSIRKQPATRLADVPQQAPVFFQGETVLDFVCRDVRAMRARLDALAETMGSADAGQAATAMVAYGSLREIYDAAAGDMAEAEAVRLLERAGLGDRAEIAAADLSGGEKNVLALIGAMSLRPDLLLLDEPGNHLDLPGLAWLEEFLRSLPCAVLVVSHDRRLLDKVAMAVLELEAGRLTRYAGNYSAYRLERLRSAAGQGQDWQADRQRVERLEALVRRFEQIARSRPDPAWGKRLRARRSQLQRVKATATERPDIGNREAAVSFIAEPSKADLALVVKAFSKVYGQTTVLEPSDFTVLNGERVALVGPNGSGKTSFIRDLIVNGSWDNPYIRVGPSMVIGYCAQMQDLFDAADTVEDAFLKILPTTRDVLAHVGKFLFGYADLSKRIGTLSGGELNRLQMARASALRANFLVLDEPTNHLDIPTREAVEEALAEFDGTVLVVSHDRYFLEKVAERVVFIADKRFNEYEGSFLEYWRDLGSAGSGLRPRSGQTDLASRGRMVDQSRDNGRRAAHEPQPSPHEQRRGNSVKRTAAVADAGAGRITDDASGLLEARIEAMELQKQQLERRIADRIEQQDFKAAKSLARELDRHNVRLAALWKQYSG